MEPKSTHGSKVRQEKRRKRAIKKMWENRNKYQDDRYKNQEINSYIKCEWLNNSLKRHRFSGGIENQGPIICCLQEAQLNVKTHGLKIKWQKIHHIRPKHKNCEWLC